MSDLDSKKIIENWSALVNAGDAQGAAALYSESAILLPTFSSEVKDSKAAILGYFEMLGAKPGAAVAINSFENITESAGVYILTGFYSFFFEEDGVKVEYPSRFTFVVRPDEEQPIYHQHSSVLPTD